MGGRYVVGLDIGTTKVCAVVGLTHHGERPEVVGMGLVPAAGLEKGMVVDMQATADAVRLALEQAGKAAGIEIRAAYVGVAGSHVSYTENHGAASVRGRAVTQEDIDQVMGFASSVCIPLDRTVLHVLPMDYVVDGQPGIADPIGMKGRRLESNVCVITASDAAVGNLERCCEMAGVDVIDVVFEPLASSRAVLKPTELRTGAAVVDIGGGTTDVAVYRSGGLRHASVLPVGGRHFTNDVAIGLRVGTEEAEKLKKLYGYALGGSEGPEEIELSDDGEAARIVPRTFLWEILHPRAREVFDLIAEEIREELRFAPSSHVVLTGGAVKLEGIDRVAEASIGLPCRVGTPVDAAGPDFRRVLMNPACSTAVGLMLYGVEAERGVYEEMFGGVRQRLRRLGRGLAGIKQRAFGFLLGM